MSKEYTQIDWNDATADDCRQIVRLAVKEDLDRTYDWTTVALVPQQARGRAAIVAREAGVIAGLPAAQTALDEMEADIVWTALLNDGGRVAAGQSVAEIAGSARDMLTSERLVLNLLGHLSGIATLTRKYVEAVAETNVRIYDTRKTTPGWRRLEKYAVRCGGGHNHRTGLFDAVLIKDNHLALGAQGDGDRKFTPAKAVCTARDVVRATLGDDPRAGMIIEVEVDTLEQLQDVLPAAPDIVLLDNMGPDLLRRAVSLRDQSQPATQLEASGGIRLETVAVVAASGVDRISVGALTHSAINLDIGLDWLT